MAAAAGVPLIGGVIGGIGSVMEAQDTADALRYESQQLDHNAKLTRIAGKYNAARLEMHAGKVIEGEAADYAGSGVAQDSASVLAVLANSRSNAEMDRLNIVNEAEFRASGLEERARSDRKGADNAILMGHFNAFASIFQGGSKSLGMMGGGGGGGGGERSIKTRSSGSDFGSAGGGDPDGWRYENSGHGTAYGPEYFGGPSGQEYV